MKFGLIAMFSRINPLSSTEEVGSTGAEAVRTAVQELNNIRNREFTATLGEPDIYQAEGLFYNETTVVVPLRDVPFNSSRSLVFDVPRNPDDKMYDFNRLLDLFNLDIETMEELDGETVPVRIIGGNIAVMWDQVDRTDKVAESQTGAALSDEEAKKIVEDVTSEDSEGQSGNQNQQSEGSEGQSENQNQQSGNQNQQSGNQNQQSEGSEGQSENQNQKSGNQNQQSEGSEGQSEDSEGQSGNQNQKSEDDGKEGSDDSENKEKTQKVTVEEETVTADKGDNDE